MMLINIMSLKSTPSTGLWVARDDSCNLPRWIEGNSMDSTTMVFSVTKVHKNLYLFLSTDCVTLDGISPTV